jgi:hypothetical protein
MVVARCGLLQLHHEKGAEIPVDCNWPKPFGIILPLLVT